MNNSPCRGCRSFIRSLIAGFLFLGIALPLLQAGECVLPAAQEQLLFNPPIVVQQADGSNGISSTPTGGPPSFVEITLGNVPANLSVADGAYLGWSVDASGPLSWRQDPNLLHAVTHPLLYSSHDLAALQAAGLPTENWPEVNYILNNMDKWIAIGANRSEIQVAIWKLIGGDPVQESDLLQGAGLYAGYPAGDMNKAFAIVQAAKAFGSNFYPGTSGITAVILDSPAGRQPDGNARQLMIIEVMCSLPAVICGEVFCDFNCDGIEDKKDADLEGVRISLFDSASGELLASKISDAAGHYSFENLTAGSYTVVVDDKTAPKWCNLIGSCPGSVKVYLSPGKVLKGIDFCFCPPPPPKGQIGDTVFCDENRNGQQDPGELGIPGVRVTLICTTATGTIVREMFTNADGSYLFTGLSAGQCTVAVDPSTAPPECDVTIPECPVEMQVDLGAGQSFLDADFCFSPPAPGEIGDTVFCDFNENGLQDPGEPGISGVRVTLNCTTDDGLITREAFTNANGNYLFTQVPAGACNVSVDASTAPPECNKIIPNCPPFKFVQLGAGESFLDADFCFAPPKPASLGDTVFCDFDQDGIQDPGEPGIPGVKVMVACATQSGLFTSQKVTDANGKYLFTDLLPGFCTVSVDQSTAPPDCNALVPECPLVLTVEMVSGETYLDADFCFTPPKRGVIGDTVFCDRNRNGIQDAGELGIEGVLVRLACVTTGGVVRREQLTDSNGKYLFTELLPGTCFVSVDQSTAPVDCNETVPRCPLIITVDLEPGGSFLDADFCFAPPVPGEIGDTVFCDENRNGRQDANEPGIEGVRVQVQCDTAGGIVFRETFTNSNGKYLFTQLPPGECTVTVDQSTAPPECNEDTPECPDEVVVMLDPGETYLDADFCFSRPPRGRIGDTVFCDENRNGIQDAGEAGIPGVTVSIECQTIVGTFTNTAVTDSNGKYLFTNLYPGTCIVRVDRSTAPDECNTTVPECPEEISVNLGEAQSFLDADFCFSPPPRGEIGDTVFCDENRNGIQDPGEPGLPGVVVSIECQTDAGTIQAVAVTDDNGTYLFTDLPAGVCTVEVDASTAPLDCNVTVPNCPTSMTVDLGPGESFLDADFCFVRCPLIVEAFCKLPAPPSSGADDCGDGKPRTITMLYTADNCSATSHSQDSGKVSCDGATTLPGSVYIVASKDQSGTGTIYFQGTVNQGETFTLDSRGDKFGSETFFRIFASQGGQVLQSVKFHTSCSQPLAVGQQFGAGLITQITFGDGRVVGGPVNPGGDSLQKDCEIIQGGGGDVCEDTKAKALSFTYTGEDCTATSTQQEPGKVRCQSTAPGGMPNTIFVVVSDNEKTEEVQRGEGKVFFSGTVTVGETFTAAASNAGEDKFGGSTYIHAFASQQGTLLQFIEFHTSCSQPLVPGDQYGGFELTGALGENGQQFSSGSNVTFVYRVSNEAQAGNAPLQNVIVTDAFGEVPGSPIAAIAPGETVELQRTVSVTTSVFNRVTAVVAGEDCAAQDAATVRIVPGGGSLECDGKIAATLLTYIGPSISSPTTVVLESNGVSTTYNLPNGLASGDTLSKPDQNGFTLDARSGGQTQFGSKMTITINGVPELHHTSCSTPYIAQKPAPLDNPKGKPSILWFVERFRDSSGNDTGPVVQPEPPLPSDNELTRFTAPSSLQAGSTVQAAVDYSNRGNSDLRVSLQNASDGAIIAEDRVSVSPGVGMKPFTVSIPAGTPVGSGYVWKAHLLPAGSSSEGDALASAEKNASIIEPTSGGGNTGGGNPGGGGGGTQPTQNRLGEVTLPTTVSSPGTVILDVPYETTERRELRIWLHDSQNGWFTIGQGNTTVERGSGVHRFTIPILPTARTGSGYVWALRLLPLTWRSADDAIDAAYESVVVERDTSAGATVDALGNVDLPSVLQAAEIYTVTVDYEATTRRDLGIWLHNPADNWRVVGQGLTKVAAGAGTKTFNIGIVGDPLIANGYIWAVRLLPEGWTSADDAIDAFYAEASVQERSNDLVNYAVLPQATASQSSVYGSYFDARLARDGNTDGDWRNASVTHTLLDTNAWWEVDLGSVKQIDHILIWNRTDCCGDRLVPYYVLVSDTPFGSADLDAARNQTGVDSYSYAEVPLPTQRVDVGRTGRYVRVQMAGANYLSLAEVEVYGPNEGPVNGATYSYYEGIWNELPDFETLNPDETGTLMDIALEASNRADFYAFRFRACLRADQEGTYTLFSNSSEGSRILINGQVVVDNAGVHGAQERSGQVTLPVGMHPMEVQFFKRDGAPKLELSWSGPGFSKQPIPAAALSVNETGVSPAFSYVGRRVQADDNADGDLLDLTAEYALGRNPNDAVMEDAGLNVAAGANGDSITVWFDRPARLSEIGYVLEHSTDLASWSPVYGSQVETDNYGWERVRYPNLELREGISIDRGFVRLRIIHYDWSYETTTPVSGWNRTVLRGGHQTHGVSLNRNPEFASTVVEANGQNLLMAAGGLASRLSFHDAYYVEILTGTHAGHRFEVDEDLSGDQRIAIDLGSSLNTLSALPEEGLEGASLLVRPHWTYEDIYPADGFQGGTDPAQADQLLFFNGAGYDSFFLLDGGGRLHWTALGSNALEDAGNTILAPGEGCFVQLAGEGQLPLLITGHIRQGAFAQPLQQGYNLVANSRPLDLNMIQRGLTLENGFLGGTDPAVSDQIQRWSGDTNPAQASYEGYFLLDAGENSGFRHWTRQNDANLDNRDEDVVFPADRAVFLRLTEESHLEYRYNP